MITIFSAPKAFTGEFALIQHNAIKSWLAQGKDVEIILFGNDQGIKETAKKYNIKHIADIKINKYGTPKLDDIFKKANKISKNNILCYVNADIIFVNNLNTVVDKVDHTFSNYLIVGRRYDLKINRSLDFVNKLQKKGFLQLVDKTGFLKNSAWVDYFIFKRGSIRNIPPFALGRTFWDKWLIYYFHKNKVPTIDATSSIMAIHQSHSYGHVKGSKKTVWQGDEATKNIQLAGGWTHGLTIDEVEYKLIGNKFTKNKLFLNPKVYFYKLTRIFLNLIPSFPLLLITRRIKNKL